MSAKVTISEKELAEDYVSKMHEKTTLATIAERLKSLATARELMGLEAISDWVEGLADQSPSYQAP